MDLFSDNSLYGMKLYQDRLLTYHNWPKQIIPDKYALAHAGFYYTGQSDLTVCFACSLKVNQWERQDKPFDEHKRLSPDCMYLKMIGHGEEDFYKTLDEANKTLDEANKTFSFRNSPGYESSQRTGQIFALPLSGYPTY